MRRLRGILSAYKMGRLDEYIVLVFGSYDNYMDYTLRRMARDRRAMNRNSMRQFQEKK